MLLYFSSEAYQILASQPHTLLLENEVLTTGLLGMSPVS